MKHTLTFIIIAAAACLALLGTTQAATEVCTNVSFTLADAFDVGASEAASSAAACDFNADGKLDLVVAAFGNPDEGDVAVLLGKGDGTFLPAARYRAGSKPSAVAVADLNGDGTPDLAVANYGFGEFTSATVSILFGTHAGTFASPVQYSVGRAPTSIAIGDLDGDGRQDIVTAHQRDSSVSVLLDQGNGRFSNATNFELTNPYGLALGDMNSDGKLDIVGTSVASNGYGVSVLLGIGDGSFRSATTNFQVGGNPLSVVVGDFNNDGKLDLATADYNDYTVSVLLADSNGAFLDAVRYPTFGSMAIAAADFNGDGSLDLAVARGGSVSVFVGNGDGSFKAAEPFSPGVANAVAVGDINGDGKVDIMTDGAVLLNACEPTVSVAANTDGSLTLTFTGTLESAATLGGNFAPVAGATSPFTVKPAEGPAASFYRASN